MRRTRIGLISVLWVGLCGCVPSDPVSPRQPSSTVVAPVPELPTATAETGADLSPVSEPPDIVGLARWRSPIATAGNLASCAGVAPIIVEVNARMGVDWMLRSVLRGSIDTRKIAGLIALDAPVDVVVALDPNERPRPPLIAVSVGLNSLDGAKVAAAPSGQTPAEMSPGVWRVKSDRGAACAVAASAGATPARLVCAEREKTLAAMAPYLARTVPGLDLGGPDIHVEARVDVMRKRYGEAALTLLRAMPGSIQAEYGVGDATFDALLFEAAAAAQDDAGKLLGDLRRVTAEVRSDKSGTCLHASGEVELSGKSSWIAGTLTDRLDRSGPPPPIYWRQPKDSEIAVYGRGADPALLSTALQKARELLEAALAAEKVGTAAERRKIAELLNVTAGKDAHTVMSHGPVNVALPTATAKGAQQKIVEASMARVFGWTLFGVEEGPAALKKQLKALVDAYKLPGVQTALKKELGRDAKHLPTVKSGAAPASLGAGAEALEITMPNVEVPGLPDAPPRKVDPVMSLTLHVLLMADGDTTWLALGLAKDELVKRLLVVKKSADEKGQLATRGGLDTLRNGKQMSGGFLSAAPVGNAIATYLQGAAALYPQWTSSSDLSVAQSLVTLPNRGQTPLFVTVNGTPGATTKVSLAIDIQQGTFEDAKSLAISSYSFFSKLGILP